MEWKTPFVVYRIAPDGKLDEVFRAEDIKKAKYWLTYIAQPGDLLCKTPVHPKHSQKSKTAEYWSHKETSGQSSTDEKSWEEWARYRHFDFKWPEEQLNKD